MSLRRSDMAELSTGSKKLDWNWVGVTFVLYVIFYLLPILLVGGVFGNFIITTKAGLFIGAWSFGAALILSAIVGFLSKGVTILEPAIGGVILVILWFLAYRVFIARYSEARVFVDIPYLVGIMISIFLLSLLGAWYGEKAQSLWRPKSSE